MRYNHETFMGATQQDIVTSPDELENGCIRSTGDLPPVMFYSNDCFTTAVAGRRRFMSSTINSAKRASYPVTDVLVDIPPPFLDVPHNKILVNVLYYRMFFLFIKNTQQTYANMQNLKQ